MNPRDHVLDEGSHWHHLANTVERSMSSVSAAMCQSNYFDDLLAAAAVNVVVFIIIIVMMMMMNDSQIYMAL